MESVGPKGKMGAFSSSNDSQSRKNHILPIFVCYSPWIFGNSSQLVLRVKQIHFQFQMNLKARKPIFYRLSCNIDHGLLVIRNSSLFLAKTFHRRLLGPY
ncbi:hypothetical protein H5410_005433 [Solanum commersonii]|uniref:Uncharacterized protein n=1 Tax=Solanum commersonii TaxID=4109 RepID=A0A9J6A882_SOLCO|nr:hypothetical protein H5410_005433 [Solanum commersonii]